MAYSQEQINAALAAELAARPNTSAYDLAAYAMQTYGITPDQIDKAYQSLNVSALPETIDYATNYGGAPVGSFRAADSTGYTGPSHKVTDPTTGKQVELIYSAPGFNPTDPTTLRYLGEQNWRDPNSYASTWYQTFATPAQRAQADALWSADWKKLNAQDIAREVPGAIASGMMPKTGAEASRIQTAAQNAAIQTTGLLSGQAVQADIPATQQTALVTQAGPQGMLDTGTTRQAKEQTMANPSALPKGFFEGLTATPNLTDQQIVSAMKAANVSPKNLADGLGIGEGEVIARVAATVPNGGSVQLGDTIIQPQYKVIGDGQDQQIGPLENIYSYRTSDNKVGGGYTQYNADGTFQRSGTQMKVNATKDFVKFALTAGALFGGAALAGLGPAVQTAGLTAAEAAGLGLTATEAAGLGFTAAELTAAGYTAADITAAGLTTTAVTAGATAAEAAAAKATADAAAAAAATTATGLTAAQLATAAKLGLTAAQFSGLLTSGGQTIAGLMQQQTSKEAADKARAMIDTETAAAKAAAGFRPVGMTTRFGTSEFKIDPVTGQLTSAGYTASPGVLEAQNRLVALGNQGLAQAEGAQAQFAPLQTGAQSLFNLGNKYIAQSPEDVAKNYLSQQMALLQPGRELELANLQNKLQQQGRGGLAVAQGGTLGATTPELQALYNARATQEAQLAAQAQQAGQQQVAFGAGLLGTGAQTMGQYYAGQQAAYAPYTTALGQFTNLEQLAQQPLTMAAGLAQQSAAAGANVGKLGLTGAGQSVELATGKAATTNPYSTALSGITSNPLFAKALESLTPSEAQSLFSQTALGQSGFGTGLAYGNQDLGLFL